MAYKNAKFLFSHKFSDFITHFSQQIGTFFHYYKMKGPDSLPNCAKKLFDCSIVHKISKCIFYWSNVIIISLISSQVVPKLYSPFLHIYFLELNQGGELSWRRITIADPKSAYFSSIYKFRLMKQLAMVITALTVRRSWKYLRSQTPLKSQNMVPRILPAHRLWTFFSRAFRLSMDSLCQSWTCVFLIQVSESCTWNRRKITADSTQQIW